MPYFLQYHNADKLGWVPLDAQPFAQTQLAIYTRRPHVQRAVGGTVFVIVSLGRPKRYYLWECFEIAEVRREGKEHCAWGTGWQLVPPQRLDGDDFRLFHKACAYFVGFRSIDGLPYTQTLLGLARRFRGQPITDAVDRFCDDLIAALPASGDARFARGWVRQRLGRHAEALVDLDVASRLGTEHAAEVEACRRLARQALSAGAAAPTIQ
jgi:hypothetical protein